MPITKTVDLLFYFYYLLVIIRIFLSWIPNIDWYNQPFRFIQSIVDPFLNIFRGIIPPIGMIDVSPIIALILLNLLQGWIVGMLGGMGL